MTLLIYDERFRNHQTTHMHPERPDRAETAYKRLREAGLTDRCVEKKPRPAPLEWLEKIHTKAHIERVQMLCRNGGGFLDGDTPVSAESFAVGCLAAGAAIDAVDGVLKAEQRNAFCLVRPPGHHATPDRAMGFCLFNTVALAAKYAIEEYHLQRILIVDWDVHHGNGTQDIFYSDPQVMFLSAHRFPFYPGTGRAEETGTGKGQGYTINLPIAYGTPRSEYLKRFSTALSKAADKIRPEMVLISAGFDAHAKDPIGSLGLETEDFGELFNMVQHVADTHAHGSVISFLEGGYDLGTLAECVELHVTQLLREGERKD